MPDPGKIASLPIGIFDSGVGGLTVMREVIRLLPRENLLYFGDTARLPYGEKSPEVIRRYTLECASFLFEKGIKLLLVACHTASCHALQELQKISPVPVIGTIEPAFRLLKGCIGRKGEGSFHLAVLGTMSTIQSGIYPSLLARSLPKAKVSSIACPLFVPFIEEGLLEHPSLELVAHHYLSQLKCEPLDAAILACTHYPLIRPLLQKVLGPLIELIEPAQECAQAVRHALLEEDLLNSQQQPPSYSFYATDAAAKYHLLATRFFAEPIPPFQIHLANQKNKTAS